MDIVKLIVIVIVAGLIGGWVGASIRLALTEWKVDTLMRVTKAVFDKLGDEGYGSKDQQETPGNTKNERTDSAQTV